MITRVFIIAAILMLSACQGGGKLIAAQMPGDRDGPYRDFQDITAERANSLQVAEQKTIGPNGETITKPAYQLPTGYRVMTPSYDGQEVAAVTSEDDLCQSPEGMRRHF